MQPATTASIRGVNRGYNQSTLGTVRWVAQPVVDVLPSRPVTTPHIGLP